MGEEARFFFKGLEKNSDYNEAKTTTFTSITAEDYRQVFRNLQKLHFET